MERVPKKGDKVTLQDWEGFTPNEVARASKEPHLIVSDVQPIPISDDDGSNRRIAYEIYVLFEGEERLVGISNYTIID